MAKENLFEELGDAIKPDALKMEPEPINSEITEKAEIIGNEKQVALVPTLPVPQDLTKDEWLMYTILQTGSIEAFEKFVALKERTQERQAKALFDENFAKMQAEFEPVGRSKQGYDYKYAPLEELQKAYGATISKYGFSYRWKEAVIESGKRCIIVISGWGHSEENYFDIPVLAGTKQMNAVQVMGAMSSYGRRYTFIAGFGIIIEDEDNENDFEADTVLSVAVEIAKIKETKNLEELAKVFSEVYNAKKADKDIDDKVKKTELALIIAAKDERKKAFEVPKK